MTMQAEVIVAGNNERDADYYYRHDDNRALLMR